VRRALSELRRFQLVDWKRRGLKRPNVYELLPLAANPNLFLDDGGNRKQRHEEYSGEYTQC
jgi:hypothetical protein